MIYYTSDMHFGDQTIFDKCKRPFEDINQFHNEIILRWNRKVKEKDTVYVLGDILSLSCVDCIDIFNRLNGDKHLIVGNHDIDILDNIRKSRVFKSIKFIDLIMDNNRKVCLNHYPIMDWIEFNRNGYLVYGHVHNKTKKNGEAYVQMKKYFSNKLAFHCGVDVHNYEPVTLDEMISRKENNKNDSYIY